MERRNVKCESSSQMAMQVEGDDGDEIQILGVTRCATPANPVTQELAGILREVRSLEEVRNSQETVIAELRADLKAAEENVERKDQQLAEADTLMKEQGVELTNVRAEKAKLEKELEEEKERRIAVEENFLKLKHHVSCAQQHLIDAESIVMDDTNLLETSPALNPMPSGSILLAKINELSSDFNRKFNELEDDQRERQCEVAMMRKEVQVLSKSVSSNNPKQTSEVVGVTVVAGPSNSNNNSTPNCQLRPRIQNVEQQRRLPAITGRSAKNCKGKHFRDITKRQQGFICVCRNKFITRKELDSHISQFGSVYSEFDFYDCYDQELNGERQHEVERVSHGAHSSKPLHCLCGQAFAKYSSLRLHVTRARFGKRFSCKICGKLHRDTFELRSHYKVSHNLQNIFVGHGCSKCGSTFPSKKDRNKHQQKYHSKLRLKNVK